LATRNAPCREACPAGVDVPRYLAWIREGDLGRALAVIRERIPFPAVCGYSCVHPCEARCTRGAWDSPVAIRALKLLAATDGPDTVWKERLANAAPTGKKVAVVGAGPCGLTAAWYLAGCGHGVTVYEARALPGGLMRYGIPAWRLPREAVEREIDLIRERSVKIITGTGIHAPEKLLAGHDAVVVATGAWRGKTAGGEAPVGVYDGLSFLTAANGGNPPPVGRRVVVVGGGNTAMDAARWALRLGAREVLVLYRRGRAAMPAHGGEVAAAAREGVQFRFRALPVRIEPGRALCVETAGDEPAPVAGSEFTVSFDTLVLAVGLAADASAVGLEGNADGTVRIDSRSHATSRPGVFAAGDAVTGPSSLIEAMAQGREVASAVDAYLGGTGIIDEDGIERPPIPWEPAPRGTDRRLDDPVRPEPEAAEREAARCLGCDLRTYEVTVQTSYCKDCGYCREACDYGVVFTRSDSFNSAGYRPVSIARTDNCVGCLRCVVTCPDFAVTIRESCG